MPARGAVRQRMDSVLMASGEVSGGGEKHIGSGRHRKDGETGLQRWG